MEYIYVKADSVPPDPNRKTKEKIRKTIQKTLPNFLILFGFVAVASVFYPLFSYYQTSRRWIAKKTEPEVASATIAYQEPQKPENKGPIIIDDIDYTKVENWFTKPIQVNDNSNQLLAKDLSTYSISIPSVNISDMKVTIGGEDLDQTLIHYEGTAMPGQLGNPVIFGHSVLPVFYNPKSYMSVFTMIPTLEKGEQIFVTYDNITYKYSVQSYHEVEPDQVELLSQRYDRKILTLVTCVPPGTYLRRGVILAQLEDYD